MFGAPLLSVHPIDNRMELEEPKDDDEGEIQPVSDDPEQRDK